MFYRTLALPLAMITGRRRRLRRTRKKHARQLRLSGGAAALDRDQHRRRDRSAIRDRAGACHRRHRRARARRQDDRAQARRPAVCLHPRRRVDRGLRRARQAHLPAGASVHGGDDVAHFGVNTGTQPVRLLAVYMGAKRAKDVIPVKYSSDALAMTCYIHWCAAALTAAGVLLAAASGAQPAPAARTRRGAMGDQKMPTPRRLAESNSSASPRPRS